MRKSLTLVAAAAAAGALAACGTTSTSGTGQLSLDRPTDIAFGCYGDLRITGGGRAGDPADPIKTTAMPTAACDQWTASNYEPNPVAEPGTQDVNPLYEPIPLGQEDLSGSGGVALPAPSYYAFILQSLDGTLAIARFPTDIPTAYGPGSVVLQDADPLTPGENSVSVGSLPVAVAVDSSGCYAITANAGTRDLTSVDITGVIALDPNPQIDRYPVTNADGVVFDGKPAAMQAQTPQGTIGVACPDTPQGLVYVAYPDCHLVAAIDLATGQIQQAIQFADDGTVTVDHTGKVTCAAGTGPRPTSLDLADDSRVGTRRLAIGAENASTVTVVDLDAGFLPTDAVTQVQLQGGVGVNDVAISPQIGMGGTDTDESVGPGGQFQFVYAVASDGTVRVASVLDAADQGECDAEIDPRYLLAETDLHKLACFHDEDLTVPPRRATATGPGIQFDGIAKPLAVTIVHGLATPDPAGPTPDLLAGWFAVVTASTGETYVINIDDRAYPDLYDPNLPVEVWLPLALPHQVRDLVNDRTAIAEEQTSVDADGNPVYEPVCNVAGDTIDVSAPSDLGGGPRLTTISGVTTLVYQALAATEVSAAKAFELPDMRKVLCTGADATAGMPVWEMQFSAPTDVRASVFPDLRAMHEDETWTLTWEGLLSNDSITEAIDGPTIRNGLAVVDGTGMRMEEASKPYCAMGVEPYDQVVLEGCDPARGNSQCDLGDVCYVHPASVVGSGTCLPADQVDALSAPCKDFLVSSRHYSVTEATSGELRIVPRLAVLRTTPVDGCTSSQQCADLAVVDAQLADSLDPSADTTPAADHTWSCEADPTRAPGHDRCVMTCDTDHPCADGDLCDGGRCVEGVVPPLQCVLGVQRYDVRASDAFTVLGTKTGYVHPFIADPSTGACVRDPMASPLEIGRIPLTAPPCTGDGPTDLTPNPCSTTVQQTELEPDYDPSMPGCVLTASKTKLVTRDAQAIRFRNAQMTMTMVDPTYAGDKACLGDRQGTLGAIPTVFPGYTIQFRVGPGFLAYRFSAKGSYPVNVVRGPQESIWVVDEGDLPASSTSSVSTRGLVFRIESAAPATVNTLE